MAELLAEGWLEGDAHLLHCTLQSSYQDVMAQLTLCGQGGAPHAVVGFGAVEGGSADAV
jgi:hypothetical protein